MAVEHDEDMETLFYVDLFLRDGVPADAATKNQLVKRAEILILEHLLKENAEFKVTYIHNAAVAPKVRLFGADEFNDDAIKRQYIKRT